MPRHPGKAIVQQLLTNTGKKLLAFFVTKRNGRRNQISVVNRFNCHSENILDVRRQQAGKEREPQ
jgi:hypothetical protein